MKTLLLLGAAALTLSGCAGGSKCADTADTACATAGEVTITAVDGSCTGSTCTWQVTATGEMGGVELDLAETGDTSNSCQTDPSCSDEGFWTEYHDDFRVADFDSSSETQAINLALVDSYIDQVSNESTIFDVSDPTISNQLTVLFTVYDKNGDYADCATYGNDVTYFADKCTNNADTW
jgi:hypothetical protein